VFKEKLVHLRDEFAQVVQEHKWAEAVRLGDIIVRDFPNTRIAQEVREKMEALRHRANETELAPSA
jgi:outer membrane protein assembly factor BamD (BamD/ComL family)